MADASPRAGNSQTEHHTVVVIGTGFGGSMTALSLARHFKKWNDDHPTGPKRTLLMLERGTWWTTPMGTVQDKEVKTYDFLVERKQPVQFWPAQNYFRGFIDIFTRCLRRRGNLDGLYELTRLGPTGFWSLFRRKHDGVSILRANGVGGGSLVYSNITIRPPDLVFRDPRWAPVSWTPEERDRYYNLAREAIGKGVLHARDVAEKEQSPAAPINTGLSNIAMRTARHEPHWLETRELNNPRGLKQLDTDRAARVGAGTLAPGDEGRDPDNRLWLDRARVFQTAMKKLGVEYGMVDLAINDYDPANPANQYGKDGQPKNYCERQGRCNVGCLPGARHTLNKQLMAAALGTPQSPTPPHPELEIRPLSEVEVVEALPEGGYRIHYDWEDPAEYLAGKPRRAVRRTVTADVVIIAAGCMGTNELLLRSKDRKTLPHLSEKTGFGFSTNGDYIAFLEKTRERVGLIRGPVTTSFGHFNMADDPTTSGSQPRFHTLEDQGIPPALASMAGVGLPFIRSLAKDRNHGLLLIWAILLWLFKRLIFYIRAPFVNHRERQELFRAEEELTARMMCVVGIGREDAVGQFRLGKSLGDTPLRVRRTDGKPFHEDPVYRDMGESLKRLAPLLRDPNDPTEFVNPFLTDVAGRLNVDSITLSHPLGGCRIAADASQGVVDEYGRVFDASSPGGKGFYEGLYVADAAIIPTALGVNPSLTISALALRISDQLAADLPRLLKRTGAARGAESPTSISPSPVPPVA